MTPPLRRRESAARQLTATYLINHLRIPGGVPKPEGLEYPEQFERPDIRIPNRKSTRVAFAATIG
jgi:hypothetical protein